MGYTGGIKYDIIFGKDISLKVNDLVCQGPWNPSSGTLPSSPSHGYWWMITGGNGVLPAPIGSVQEGEAIFYVTGAGWFKGKANNVGVYTINGKDGVVTLTSDDITDVGMTNKFITSGEKLKLSGIEVGAEVNDTAAEIKVKYESNADTNAFTDVEKSKLSTIASGAQVNTVEKIIYNGAEILPDGSKAITINAGTVFKLCPAVPTYADLLLVLDKNDGDVRNVTAEGNAYYWLTDKWESLGGEIDMSNYYDKTLTYSKSEINALLVNKVSTVVGKGLSTNDYTDLDKAKLTGIEDGAQVNTGDIKVSLTDTLAGKLSDKLKQGTNITLTVVNSGADEQIEISAVGGGVSAVSSVNLKTGDVVLSKTDIGLDLVDNLKQMPMSYLDTTTTMAANSDVKVPSQKAVKTYIDGLTSVNAHGVANMPTITDNGNGSITIGTDGIMQFHKDSTGSQGLVRLAVTNGATLTLTDNAESFIYCSYNSGTPTYLATQDVSIFYSNSTLNPIARIYREGTVLNMLDYANYGLAQSEKILYKDTILNGIDRISGLLLTTSTGNTISVSNGKIWFGTKLISLTDIATGTSNLYSYYKVSGAWAKSTALNTFDNIYYDNGIDRFTLADNKYVAKYIYRNASKDEIFYVNGDQMDSIASAIAEKEPSSLPPLIAYHCVYVGKIVVKKSNSLGTAYGRLWGERVLDAIVKNHNDLENIEQADTGVTNGHISNVYQKIYGQKEFTDIAIVPDEIVSGLSAGNLIPSDKKITTLANNIENAFSVGNLTTGFTNVPSISVSYNSTNRTITLSGAFEAYYKGKKISSLVSGYVSPAHGVTLDTTYYLYYNGTSIVWDTVEPSTSYVVIAQVYYGTTLKLAIKRTSGFMQAQDKDAICKNIGCFKKSGGEISDYTLLSTTPLVRRPTIAQTELACADITSYSEILNTRLYSLAYISGNSIAITNDYSDICNLNGAIPYYNKNTAGVWSQEPMTSGQYQSIFLLSAPVTTDTANKKNRYLFVQGQEVSTDLSTIQGITTSNLELTSLTSVLPSYVFLAKIIIYYNGTDWTIHSITKVNGNQVSQLDKTINSLLKVVNVDPTTMSGKGTLSSPLNITPHTSDHTNPHAVTATQVGLGNVNNTADLDKPISTATQDELYLRQSTFTGICQKQYLTENDIVVNASTLTLTIATVRNGTTISAENPIVFYTDSNGTATRHVKTTPQVFTFTKTNGVWYFYFDQNGNPIATQTTWTDFATIATVYRIYVNDQLATSDCVVVQAFECHKNDISWADHTWKHSQGTIWQKGLVIASNKISTGTPASNGANTCVALTSGTCIDDNLSYTVTNGTGTGKFTQDLGNTSSILSSNSAIFKIRTNDSAGRLNFLAGTRFPFAWNTVNNKPQYIDSLGNRVDVTNGYFFVYFIYALQDPRNGETIKIVSASTDYTTSNLALASSWETLQQLYPTLTDNEIRPLYKLTFEYKGTFDVLCKYSALREIEDIRRQRVQQLTSSSGTLPATSVSFTPIGNISSTNVQSAIEELDNEKISSSTASNDNAISRYDGITGKVIQTSLATISDTGSINIPTGQNFTINTVALKDVSETLTNKTINSPIITGTPTGITATHVGLGNVTNNAQVKKIASSTDNAIMRWDGLTGDLPQDSLVTISDTGTINIPSGQNYNINGVALKDVSEILTNKTLTSPVLNVDVTGTGVTTVGANDKLIKTTSAGGVYGKSLISKSSYTGATEGNTAMWLENTNASGGVISVKKNTSNTSPYIYDSIQTATKNYNIGLVGSYAWKISNATDSIDLLGIDLNSGEITGTGVTTVGEINKLVKTSASGSLCVGGTNTMVAGMTGNVPKIIASSVVNSVILNKAYDNSPASAGILSLAKSRGFSVGVESTTLTGDVLGYISFEGVTTGNTAGVGVSIETVQNGTAGATYIPTDLLFKTSDGSTFTERMRVSASGNIGIGTSTPKSKLQLGTRANIFNGNGTDSINYLDLGYNVHYNGGFKYTVGTSTANDTGMLLEIGSGGFGFYTAPAGNADANIVLTEKLRINSSGVGIGTNSPTIYGAGTNTLSINGSTGSGFLDIWYAGTRKGYLYSTANNFDISTTTSTSLSLSVVGNTALAIDTDKNITATSLIGTGTRAIFADANGKLTNASGALKDNWGVKISVSAGENINLMDIHDISFHYVNDTTLRICMKGEDGVMRRVNLTLS